MSQRISISAEANYGPGSTIHLDSARGNLKVVFRDDGKKSWFTSLENIGRGYAEIDAVQIYSVADILVRGNNAPMLAQIAWSKDSKQALLLMNREPCALFDFAAHCGYSRSVVGMPVGNWRRHHQDLNDFCSLFSF